MKSIRQKLLVTSLSKPMAGVLMWQLFSLNFLMEPTSILFIMLSNSISLPIKKCVTRIEELSEGDLKSPVPEVAAKDETGILARSTNKLVTGLRDMFGDADYLLGEMGAGNFNVSSRASDSYVGDFRSLNSSINKIKTELAATINEMSEQIRQSADNAAHAGEAGKGFAVVAERFGIWRSRVRKHRKTHPL